MMEGVRRPGRLGPKPEQSLGVQRLLADALARPRRSPHRDELTNELIVGGAFLVAAIMLAVLGGEGAKVEATDALVVFIGLVLGARVVFEVGSCYTTPVQLAFVPALFILPPALAPLLVAGAYVVARSIEVAQGTLRPGRIVNSLGDSWFAIGPALVLVLADTPAADGAAVPVLLGALAAQFAFDSVASRVRERLHGGASLREQLVQGAWIYLVDVLLSPIGFALGLAAATEPAAIVLSWPVFLLLGVFAREREDRLASLLELSEAYRGTARVLGEVVEHDDAYTGFHIRGVAELAIEVGADLGLNEKQRRLVEFGALLHDVGKIAIPKEIINKPGQLDDLEWRVVRTHTIEGQRMLERIGGLMSSVGRIVRWSHERWDGLGYPDRLRGDQIPIESRIVFCCDAWHAMTTTRIYRKALTHEVAVAELLSNSGSQFDPSVVEALLHRVDPQRRSLPAKRATDPRPRLGVVPRGNHTGPGRLSDSA